jgi:hypothetical protein
MTPLIQAPSIIPQLILSLCTMSIATCNKLFENMMLFNGDHKDTKIIGTVNGRSFYWKIDTGSAVTCMNIHAFETAFGKPKERNLKDFKKDIFIKKEEVYTHGANSRRIKRKHFGHRLSAKIRATLRPQNQGSHISVGTI